MVDSKSSIRLVEATSGIRLIEVEVEVEEEEAWLMGGTGRLVEALSSMGRLVEVMGGTGRLVGVTSGTGWLVEALSSILLRKWEG